MDSKDKAHRRISDEAIKEHHTNEILKDRFIQDVGQKAVVQRESVQNEHMDQLRGVISDIGEDLLKIGVAPKGMKYEGSLCVHVYSSVILRQAAFVTTNNLGSLNHPLADAGLRDLNGWVTEHFQGKRQKLRSGF